MRAPALTALLLLPALALGAADPPAPAAPSGPERLARAEAALARVRRNVQVVSREVEDARGRRDLVRLLCLDDRALQMRALLRRAEGSGEALRQAVARKDAAADAELARIELLRSRVDALRTDAEACMGELANRADGETALRVETPREPPVRAVVDPAPPPATLHPARIGTLR